MVNVLTTILSNPQSDFKDFHMIFKVGETDLCSCGQAAETAQHVLQDCRLFSHVRQSIWRERVDMHTKLYVPLPELEKTVAFIAQAEIGI